MTMPAPKMTPMVASALLALFQLMDTNHNQPQIYLELLTLNNQDHYMKSALKTNRELTPKVNHTKMTISSSSPFLIKRHHLNDSQMRKVLRHEQTLRQQPSRTYSYQGERITCQRSDSNSRVEKVDQLQTPTSKLKQTSHYEYYNIPGVQPAPAYQTMQPGQNNQQMPYFKNNRQLSEQRQRQLEKDQYNNETVHIKREIERMAREMRAKEDFELQKVKDIRKRMEKQARRLGKQNKDKVEKDINRDKDHEVDKLEEKIRRLKIKTLEAEKLKLKQELTQTVTQTNIRQERNQSQQRMVYTRGHLILKKPRYRPKPSMGEDTDSSFSSFQLD